MKWSSLLLVLAAAVLAGCSSVRSPSGPVSVRDIRVWGIYYYFPGGAPTGITGGVEISIWECGGERVPDLTVLIHGHELEYQSATQTYTGVVSGLASGQDIVISISDGSDSISDSARVPYRISSPQLEGGSWDCSSEAATNRWSWTNPASTSWYVAHRIYDYDGESGTPVFDSWVE